MKFTQGRIALVPAPSNRKLEAPTHPISVYHMDKQQRAEDNHRVYYVSSAINVWFLHRYHKNILLYQALRVLRQKMMSQSYTLFWRKETVEWLKQYVIGLTFTAEKNAIYGMWKFILVTQIMWVITYNVYHSFNDFSLSFNHPLKLEHLRACIFKIICVYSNINVLLQ